MLKKRVLFFIILILISFLTFSLNTFADSSQITVFILPWISHPQNIDTIYLGYAFFGSYFYHLNGVMVSNLFSIGVKNSSGCSISGLFNLYLQNYNGMQFSSIFNCNFLDYNGIQVSLISNFNFHDFNGLQISTLLNFVGSDLKGYQVGLFNTANKLKGFQIGLLNLAFQNNGLQLGLFNFALKSKGYSIGLINIIFDGYNVFGINYDEIGFAKFFIKFGGKHFFTTLQMGMNREQTDILTTFGFGLHLSDLFAFFDIELTHSTKYNLNEIGKSNIIYYEVDPDNPDEYTYYYESPYNGEFSYGSLKVSFGYKILKNLSLIASITYNIGYRINFSDNWFEWYKPENIDPSLKNLQSYTFFKYGWYGFNLGIQIHL